MALAEGTPEAPGTAGAGDPAATRREAGRLMARAVPPAVLFEALRCAGLADGQTRRVVIDIGHDLSPIVYMGRYGDERLLSVIQTLGGIDIDMVPVQERQEEPHDRT